MTSDSSGEQPHPQWTSARTLEARELCDAAAMRVLASHGCPEAAGADTPRGENEGGLWSGLIKALYRRNNVLDLGRGQPRIHGQR